MKDPNDRFSGFQLSTAAKGNFLQALNMSLHVFEQHQTDCSFNRTGYMVITITAGVGVFEVDYSLGLIFLVISVLIVQSYSPKNPLVDPSPIDRIILKVRKARLIPIEQNFNQAVQSVDPPTFEARSRVVPILGVWKSMWKIEFAISELDVIWFV